jgi:predicted secreted hydrolase
VQGLAWLDHEWSSRYLDRDAQGWDWVGLNLNDGDALMAFRIRRPDGAVLWSAATWREAGQARPVAARFEPLRWWRSPRSGARYPVAMRVTVDARSLEMEPLMDDQELDARASTAAFYWEGAVRVLEGGRRIGLGYLELTGYAGALKM